MVKCIKSFRKTIKLLFLKYTFIPILILFLLFTIFIVAITKINIIINTKQAGDNISQKISEVYKNYYEQINMMASSENVINYINTHSNTNLIYDDYYKFNNNQKVKGILSIIDTNDVFVLSTTDCDANISRSIINNIIPKLNRNPNDVLSEINILAYQYNKNTTYTFAKAVKSNEKVIGYLVYQLYEEDFSKLLFENNNQLAVITDRHNRIISTNNTSLKGLMNKFIPQYIEDNENYVNISGNKYYIVKDKIYDAPIYIYTLNGFTIKNDIFIIYFSFIILVSIVLLILINYLANKMSASNTESIDKLIYSVNELKHGNMNSYVNINSRDEFEILANEFNIMLDTLHDLMKKNEELLSLNYASEVNLLQSQFNPHFIFNILSTLRYSIFIDPKESENIIMGLSRLLRYSIDSSSQKVILANDLCYIKDYLELNKFRFKEKLEYNINISAKAKTALIPKLLLQTFVENSIKYGYKDKEYIVINITGDILNKKLILELTDNGSGITQEQLNNIMSVLNNPNNTSNHIGLYNAYRRLVLLYGDNQSFKIKSTVGIGTSIKLTIPYEKGNSDV
ncbi:sensor histidine kinase [Clostridium beijerinckii]|uniref:HAMP domain-containing protein n=2 Tax=Clostridium TaxID=1485 RepID=A0A1S9NBU5_CLOBE|nr:histidine kinase [Clostridium beijerinckii]MBN7573522.1 histidine kinase [Clostridium beijerinckii]MBN7579129.1 histidine kinase [Clostridium beijerinckii]MBN7583565.1 histidine kinase [Clostridium beijerinckii]MBO0519762.1 histidine kinase [Clostridium beijerinckii]MZK51268.1 sensor histidine kinase [Clostridium beijerinckii]